VLPYRLEQNLFALQTAENQATRQAGFAADKAQSDDEVFWDDDNKDDDDSPASPLRAKAPLMMTMGVRS
jgi:hypothetical protein